MSDEQPADMLARLGSNGLLWAQEFHKTAVRLGYSEMDEGWLIGWFANAIENSCNPLRNECDALRAELAAERESATKANLDFVKILRRADALEAERDALRELLVEARHEWLGSCQIGSARAELRLDVFMSRIDAALNEGGGK